MTKIASKGSCLNLYTVYPAVKRYFLAGCISFNYLCRTSKPLQTVLTKHSTLWNNNKSLTHFPKVHTDQTLSFSDADSYHMHEIQIN